MEIEQIRINWGLGWDNAPSIQVLCSNAPKMSELRYRYHEPGLYWAELDGYVDFYSYTRPGQGFGGRTLNIIMEDCREVALKGPWSSSCSSMNRYFPHSTEVSFTERQSVMDGNSGVFYASYLLVDFLEEALERLRPELELVSVGAPDRGELSTDQMMVVTHGTRVENTSVRYFIACADGRAKPCVSDIKEWDDKTGWTNSFSELYHGLGIESEFAMDVFHEFWKREYFDRHAIGRESDRLWKECKARYSELEYPTGTERWTMQLAMAGALIGEDGLTNALKRREL